MSFELQEIPDRKELNTYRSFFIICYVGKNVN